jgi:hypothetical protein
MKFPTRTLSTPLKEHRRLKQVEPNSPRLSKRRLRSSLTISKPPSCYLRTTICLTLRSARFWAALQKLSKREFIVSGSSLRSGWQRSFKPIRLASATPFTFRGRESGRVGCSPSQVQSLGTESNPSRGVFMVIGRMSRDNLTQNQKAKAFGNDLCSQVTARGPGTQQLDFPKLLLGINFSQVGGSASLVIPILSAIRTSWTRD